MDHQAESKAARRSVETTGWPAAVLPDDVLADILRRLAPRGLAASRCVCKAWHDVIDARRLLRAELLPLSPGGIFLNFNNYGISEFLARPSTAAARPSISGKHDYLPVDGIPSWSNVSHHCNGLLLISGYDHLDRRLAYVLNPGRWCAPLPPCPPPLGEMMDTLENEYLVYDPTISPHYEVFSITRFRFDPSHQPDPAVEESEWPPSLYFIRVYSSRTGCWEERTFTREGEAAGTIDDMRESSCDQYSAVYWRGALYVHCQCDFVMRISLSDNKYQVIKPPRGIEVCFFPQFHLGKSEKGVYCASTANRGCRIRVWLLNQSPCGKIDWVLIHDNNIIEWLFDNKLHHPRPSRGQVIGPWILDDVNCYYDKKEGREEHDGHEEAPVEERLECMKQASEGDKFPQNTDNEDKMYDSDDNMAGEKSGSIPLPLVDEKIEWSSDEDMLDGKYYSGYLDILGFHPYKEILFLGESITRGLAYHLKSSKVQILGNIYPAKYHLELGDAQLIVFFHIHTMLAK